MIKNHSPTQPTPSWERIEQLLLQLIDRLGPTTLAHREQAADFITPRALKDKYGISYTTLQRWKRNSVLQVYRVPGTGKLYIRESEFVELLQAGKI